MMITAGPQGQPENYRVLRAALIPHAVVLEFATRVEHTNSWRFMLRDSVWLVPSVVDVTSKLQRIEDVWVECIVDGPEIVPALP